MALNQSDILVPSFDLQSHHERVEVPSDFDMRDLARKYHVFPLKAITQHGKRRLLLAMRNPFDQTAILDVEFRSGLNVIAVQADFKDIQWLMQVHYYGRKLSPSPSFDEHFEMTQDVFSQLEMIQSAQADSGAEPVLVPLTVNVTKI